MGLFRDFMTSFTGAMKLGRDTNHTLLEEDGTLVAVGDAICFEDENFDLINLRGVGSNPDPITIPTTNLNIAGFSSVQIEEVETIKELRHSWATGTPISFHFHPCATDNNSGVAVFKLEIDFVGTDEPVPTANYTTLRVEVAIEPNKPFYRQNASFPDVIPSGNFVQMPIRFYRDTTDPADTYGSDVGVYTLGYHLQKNMLGSRQITTK